MAKVLKLDGFPTAIRVDRITAVDRIKDEKGWVVRIFAIGIDGGYHLQFKDQEELSEKVYKNIVCEVQIECGDYCRHDDKHKFDDDEGGW